MFNIAVGSAAAAFEIFKYAYPITYGTSQLIRF